MATKAKEATEAAEATQAAVQAQAGIRAGELTPGQVDPDASAKMQAEQSKYEAEREQYQAQGLAYQALPAKYNRTFLGLSIEYIHYTMTQQIRDISVEDLALIEAMQDGVRLVAAATLCASGRF